MGMMNTNHMVPAPGVSAVWRDAAASLVRFHEWERIDDGDVLYRRHGDDVDIVFPILRPRNAETARPGDVLLTVTRNGHMVQHLIRCGDWLYADDVERAVCDYADDVLPALIREAHGEDAA